MNKKENYIFGITSLAFSAAIFFGTYIKIWESKQPQMEISKARIESVDPYIAYSGLGSRGGYKANIGSKEKPINFSISNWDQTVKEGDLVDLIVKESFFGNSLKGLSIKKKNK